MSSFSLFSREGPELLRELCIVDRARTGAISPSASIYHRSCGDPSLCVGNRLSWAPFLGVVGAYQVTILTAEAGIVTRTLQSESGHATALQMSPIIPCFCGAGTPGCRLVLVNRKNHRGTRKGLGANLTMREKHTYPSGACWAH